MSTLIVEVVQLKDFIQLEGADNIEVAVIHGWNCVVRKGAFQAGDLAIYIPQDSILPQELVDKYELTYLKSGNKVGQLKLNKFKVLSQGLVLRIPEDMKVTEGENVAERLGITKWEPEVPEYQRVGKSGGPQPTKLRPNPNFSRYDKPEHLKWFTDSEGKSSIFTAGEEVFITEKIHGTNSRFGFVVKSNEPEKVTFWKKGLNWVSNKLGKKKDEPVKEPVREFAVGSANVHLCGEEQEAFLFYPENPYWKIAQRLNLRKIAESASIFFGTDVTLFGEIYGPGIQDLTYESDDINVAFFDLKVGDKYVDYDDFVLFCKFYKLQMAPLLYRGPWVDGLEKLYTSGKSVLAAKQIREGIVIKPVTETNTVQIGRKSLKNISEEYYTRKDATEFH